MNLMKYVVLIIASVISLPACSQENWESDPPRTFIAKVSNEVPEDKFIVVADKDFESAAANLVHDSLKELSWEEANRYLRHKERKADQSKRYFLARAVSDRRNGVYSLYIDKGVLRILWGGFGPCYKVLTNSAVVVETDQSITSAYASCSGVD